MTALVLPRLAEHGTSVTARGRKAGPLEREVLKILDSAPSPDEIDETLDGGAIGNAIARLARELDERAGPILGKPAETEREAVCLPAYKGEDPGVLRAELDITDGLLNDRDGFILSLAGILGECPAHGPTCLPHLLQAVRELAGREGRITCGSIENRDDDPRDWETCRETLEKAEAPKSGGLRVGQAAFGVLSLTNREKAGILRGTGADPFYDDAKLPAFWAALGCAPAEDAAKSWRPLVEGDVIMAGDKIRAPYDFGDVVTEVVTPPSGGGTVRIAGYENLVALPSLIRSGWKVLR